MHAKELLGLVREFTPCFLFGRVCHRLSSFFIILEVDGPKTRSCMQNISRSHPLERLPFACDVVKSHGKEENQRVISSALNMHLCVF